MTTLHGSSWDTAASPDQLRQAHLAEWVSGSAVDPQLAAANLQTIAGADVLQALAGTRLEQLGGWAQQYATGSVQRLLQPLEPVAAAGGWWCSGLDPLADWRPMGWGCFKPDQPRWDAERSRARKYEHPLGESARLFVLRVPAAVARRIARRHQLIAPPEVLADVTGADGAFWRWVRRDHRLPIVITEGAKKAAALLTAGLVAVALPGIWNGAVRSVSGHRRLHPDLEALGVDRRSWRVLFDWSASRTGRRDVARAARRQGWLLQRAGAATVLLGCCPGPAKGADDFLAAGGKVTDLLAGLAPLAPLPVLPRLRSADQLVAAGQFIGEAITLPTADDQPLVAISAPMGAGKTRAIAAHLAPLMAAGVRVVLITHRRSLCASLAAELDLPWGDDAAPGSDLRQRGVALCIDSLCPGSGLRINPADWRGCIVVMDEATAVLAHALMGTATAVAQRRPVVLQTLQQLLSAASQTLIADAQLDDPTLEAIETATGHRAWLIRSTHRPAAGRQLMVLEHRDQWRGIFRQHLEQRRRLWVAVTAKTGPNGAEALALAAMQHWPEARILVVDSDTVADPLHPASQLAADPNGIASQFDLVIATPAIAAGLSVDQLPGHFHAVMVAAGGTTDANAVAQAAARVRDDCPRIVYAPARSPGNALRLGCGSSDPDQILSHLGDHAALVGQLLTAGGYRIGAPVTGPWLPLWAKLAGQQNAISNSYRATVTGLLQREGYRITTSTDDAEQQQRTAGAELADDLEAIAAEAQQLADAAIAAAPLLSDQEAQRLERKRHRSPADRAALQRYRIAQRWQLADAPPTPELLEADRNGALEALRFRWQLTSTAGRQQAAQQDLIRAQQLSSTATHWQPDLLRQQQGPRLQVADALGLASWLSRSDWFTADDPQLQALHDQMTRCSRAVAEVLGITAHTAGGNSRLQTRWATTTLRRLLALVGYRLEAQRSMINGRRAWRYRLTPLELPAGCSEQRLQQHWAQMGAQQSPFREGRA